MKTKCGESLMEDRMVKITYLRASLVEPAASGRGYFWGLAAGTEEWRWVSREDCERLYQKELNWV